MKTQKSNLQKGNKNTQSHVSVSKQARKKTSTKKYPNSISNTERFVEIHHPPGAIQKVKG